MDGRAVQEPARGRSSLISNESAFVKQLSIRTENTDTYRRDFTRISEESEVYA
jgi:hypothetical protein